MLSKARRRFGVTVYQAFFTEIVRQCERAGLIRGDRLYLDSTLVEANANLDSVGSRALVAQLAGVDEHVASAVAGESGPAERLADADRRPPTAAARPPAVGAAAAGRPRTWPSGPTRRTGRAGRSTSRWSAAPTRTLGWSARAGRAAGPLP